MLTIRPASERGHADHGWLDTWHTFSFANYYDPRHMGYRSLRVINDDVIAPGRGFGTHPHEDMEIITWVLDGELAHRDSMGTGAVLRHGDVQRMSAGTGLTHSEFNASREKPVRLLQIWIEPAEYGVKPRYEDRAIPLAERQDRLRLLASGDGRDGSLDLHQDADIYVSTLGASKQISHRLRPGRGAWIQIARGTVDLGGKRLVQGDGVVVEDEGELTLKNIGHDEAELLLFDLA
jgi:redox-sensitive bicupin YhaK (pirin superfamily)